MIIDAHGLRVRYPGSADPALDSVSLSLAPGELAAIGGPNGSGKTTLLRTVLGLARREAGSVEVAGRPVERWSRRELARVLGVVAQREETVFPVRVWDTVMLGRYARLGSIGAEGTTVGIARSTGAGPASPESGVTPKRSATPAAIASFPWAR